MYFFRWHGPPDELPSGIVLHNLSKRPSGLQNLSCNDGSSNVRVELVQMTEHNELSQWTEPIEGTYLNPFA
jgi:hypothetical protein